MTVARSFVTRPHVGRPIYQDRDVRALAESIRRESERDSEEAAILGARVFAAGDSERVVVGRANLAAGSFRCSCGAAFVTADYLFDHVESHDEATS